jgi:phage major head subunit gpT-like protein
MRRGPKFGFRRFCWPRGASTAYREITCVADSSPSAASFGWLGDPVHWKEMRDELGERVSTAIIKDASHALFLKQPLAVVDPVLPWMKKLVP